MKKTIKIVFLLLGLAGCTNITEKRGNSRVATSGNPAFASFVGVTDTHDIKNALVAAVASTSGNQASNLEITLSVDTGLAGFQPLTGFCGLGQTNPCSCELKWVQTTPDEVNFNRTRRLPVTVVQTGLVKCLIPQSVWDEIGVSTQIQMNIVPAANNTTGLSCRSIYYKKGTVIGANGDFLDSTLTPFRNIRRYSCFTKRRASYEINNRVAENLTGVGPVDPANDYERGAANVIIGSKFCVGAVANTGGGNANSGGGGASFSCNTTVRSGFSAQNYYRSFYVRSDTLNLSDQNNTFECPSVLESIKTSAQSASGNVTDNDTLVPTTEQNKLWPMDSTFALSTTFSPDWNVPVSAASRLFRPGDPTSTNTTTCAGETAAQILTEPGLIRDCLGYAKRPNADGTCGTIRDNNGRVRPLVRLRRYRAILPGGSSNEGRPLQTNLNADEIYVPDRLVIDGNGVATGEMIYGPKPCNYAWFDHEGITNRTGTTDFGSRFNGRSPSVTYAIPRYVATSRFFRNVTVAGVTPTSGWDGPHESVNPDGLVFPNVDVFRTDPNTQFNEMSCSATLPRVVYANGQVTSVQLFTTHYFLRASTQLALGAFRVPLDEVHLQPVDPWNPDYLEDQSFQACVPVSDAYLEAPMHVFRNASGDYGWCSKIYPTQNSNWVALNRWRRTATPPVDVPSIVVDTQARVSNFTSYVMGTGALDSRNSCTGTGSFPICKMTTGNGADPFCKAYLNGTALPVLERRTSLTCDRTAMYSPFKEYQDFPLQAPTSDIVSMLTNDLGAGGKKNFSCAYSVSPDPTKIGKRYPSTGCCGKFGSTTILSGISGGGHGHLEPQINPQVPDVRFCGWPVR
jgi:hypothetical protein